MFAMEPGGRVGGVMRIGVRINRFQTLRWHQWLISDLLSMPDCDVSLIFSPIVHPVPMSCLLAMELERAIYGIGAGRAVDRIQASELESLLTKAEADRCDVVIDLIGDGSAAPECVRVLTPLFNGVPGEIGAIAAVLSENAVWIDVCDSAFAASPLRARPAMVDRQVLLKALDGVLSRAIDLVLKALSRSNLEERVGAEGIVQTRTSPTASHLVIARVAKILVRKSVGLIGSIAARRRSWVVAHRSDGDASLLDQRRATFSILSDDNKRFYADPFPFEYNGRFYLFVEEYPYATARGCIAVASVDEDGRVSRPRVIIEEPYHLSYPFVFKRDEQIWMVPESGAAGRVDLYRAVHFPYCWRREGSILEGVAAYDATLGQHGDLLWMMTVTKRWKSTSWDQLSLFHSRDLLGPWRAHHQNPILIDSEQSRSAGAMFMRHGKLMRPVQDCSQRYGGATAICLVHILNEMEFHQTIVGRVECGALGCHTYNRSGRLEVIDIFGAARRGERLVASYTRVTESEEVIANLIRGRELGEACVSAETEH
jgi:hypothetical protein